MPHRVLTCAALAALAPVAAAQCDRWLPAAGLTGFSPAFGAATAVWDSDGPGSIPERLIVGGQFAAAGGTTALRLAAWNGDGWISLGDLNAVVYSLHASDSDLYAGGSFTQVGSTAATRIARFDGTQWHALGAGLDGNVYTIAEYNGSVCAGGAFTHSGPDSVARLGLWNGTTWTTLGEGVAGGDVADLTVHEGELIAGGGFTAAGGSAGGRLARWNGVQWQSFGAGPSGNVRTLLSHGGFLYIGGAFITMDGVTARYIARWNGATFEAMETGFFGNANPINGVNAIAAYNGTIVAAGSFVAGQSAPSLANIAIWNGVSWASLGTGIGGPVTSTSVRSLAVFHSELAVTGQFTLAGSAPADNFARWNVTGLPWFTAHPSPQSVWESSNVQFGAAAAPGYAVSYLWRRNGAPVSNGAGGASPGGGVVAGATAPSLSIAGVRASDAGAYTCLVTSSCGDVSSNAAALSVACYPDCNGDTTLNLADFGCFTTKFALGNPYADCNGDSIRNLADFGCFTTKFALGCP